jgi:hypothetical protein
MGSNPIEGSRCRSQQAILLKEIESYGKAKI